MESGDVLPPLNIRDFAIDIAHRLSSLGKFLEAAEHLLRRNDLFTDEVVKHHGRKVGIIITTSGEHFSPLDIVSYSP